MRLALAAIALLAVLSSLPAGAAPRSPTGKWIMDFQDTQCVASRNYGTAEKPLLLVFKQPVAGQVMRLAVISKDIRRLKYAEQLDGRISVGNAPAVRSTMVKSTPPGRRERVIALTVPLAKFVAVRSGQVLTVSAPPELNETFQLTSFEPLMKLMDQCVTDLAKLWNRDAGQRLKQPPEGTLQGLIRDTDYPDVATFNDMQGTMRFVALINEQGRVADCTVVESSGAASLDSQSCAVIIQRARFKPAIGLDGKPAKSTFQQQVTWRLK